MFRGAELVERQVLTPDLVRLGLKAGGLFHSSIEGTPFCLDDCRYAAKMKLMLEWERVRLVNTYRKLLEAKYFECLEQIPFIASAHPVHGVGEGFEETHERGVVRYSDSGNRLEVFSLENRHAVPNQPWLLANHFDQYFVRKGWLIHEYVEESPGGDWNYFNVRDAVTNPDGTIGCFRGTVAGRVTLDTSKVLRFRVPTHRL